MSIVAIAGSAFTYYLPGLEDQSNPGLFKAAPTISAGDFTISVNGGAFGALDNTPTVSPVGSTQIAIVLSAAETTEAGAGGRITVNCQDTAGAEWYSVGLAIPVQAADVSTLGGTAQTGDAYAVVTHTDYGNAKLVRSTTPANTLDVSATGEAEANVTQLDGDPVPLDNLVLSIQSGGYVRANLMQILGTTLTETAGLIAAAFSKFFNKATPTGTVNSLPDAVAGAAGGLALAGADGDTLETLSDQLDSVTTLGAGAIAFTYTLTSSLDASPIADADIWATSDANGATVLASGRTNSSGQATFFLDAGTVYIWRQKSGWNFTNPDTETVS